MNTEQTTARNKMDRAERAFNRRRAERFAADAGAESKSAVARAKAAWKKEEKAWFAFSEARRAFFAAA